MKTSTFTQILGTLFLVLGILGVFPVFVSLPHPADPALAVSQGYGRLFGLFPVNVLHSVFHVLLGVWAFGSARSQAEAASFDRLMSIVYGVFAVMGVLPILDIAFGFMPLFGANVWLSLAISFAAGYYGYRETPKRRVPRTSFERTPVAQ